MNGYMPLGPILEQMNTAVHLLMIDFEDGGHDVSQQVACQGHQCSHGYESG